MITIHHNNLRQYISQSLKHLIPKTNTFASPLPHKNRPLSTNQFIQSHKSVAWTQFKRQGLSQQITRAPPLSNNAIKQVMTKKRQSAFYRRLIETQHLLNGQQKIIKKDKDRKQQNIVRQKSGKTQSRLSKRSRIVVQSHNVRASTCFEHNDDYLETENNSKYLKTKLNRQRAKSSVRPFQTFNL